MTKPKAIGVGRDGRARWTLHLSVRSQATSLVNLQSGYQLANNVKLALDVFNLLNVANSEIDYFYTSRLPGEPAGGIDDIHTHPTLPRTARVNLVFGF